MVADLAAALEVHGVTGRAEILVCTEAAPKMAELVALAGDGWSVYADGTSGARWPTLRRDGRVVRWLAAWTGRPMDVKSAVMLWGMLEAAAMRLAPGLRPIGAPGTTGRDAWLRLIPDGVSYPLLADDTAELLRSTSAQGRVEPSNEHPTHITAGPDIGGVWEYDARLAYLAALGELPAGEPTRLGARQGRAWLDANPYGRGRYEVDFAAPAGWGHVGILRADGAWPLEGTGWADGSEVALAQRHGWAVSVRQALVWERTCSPFRGWADRLVRTMGAPPRGADADVWRAVWRAVALHTIGAMHGAPRKVTRIAPTVDMPADAEGERPIGGDLSRWVETSSALWPETHHPEWTSTIWSRARCRLLDAPAGKGRRVGALHVPAGDVLAFHTDAIYLARPADWPDDGALGRFRAKRSRAFPRPQPRPTTQAALLALLDAPGGTP